MPKKQKGKKRGRPSSSTPRRSSRITSTSRRYTSSSNGRSSSSCTARGRGRGRGRGTQTPASSQASSSTPSQITQASTQTSTQSPSQAPAIQTSPQAPATQTSPQAPATPPVRSVHLLPFELQQIYDQRSARGSVNTPITSPAAHISPEQLQQMSEVQLRQLLAQISAHLPPTNPPTQPSTGLSPQPPSNLSPQWSRPHLPASQSELVRDTQATAAANSFLQSSGISQNLPSRASDIVSTRPQYPAPVFALQPQVVSPQQQILALLQNTARQSTFRRDKAIQLSDYISPTATFEEDRLMAAPDGSIKMGKPSLKFYDVPSWGVMALTSAKDFVKLNNLKDPRVVNFNLLEYLFYLQTTFVKFKRYNFKQVLQYDRAYRTLQLRENFVWGTHIPELYQCHLSGHNKPEVARKPKAIRKAPWQHIPKTCHTFNRGLACTFNPCSYLHQCTKCGKGHPAASCPAALNTAANTS